MGALGVVFGDIGTSPLYTIQTVFNPGDPHPVSVARDTIFGIASLIFWSVTIIVTVTYVLLVMRADNDGEGGIMALITLIRRRQLPGGQRTKLALAALGIFGASLFLGDSMITPAISMLSSVEGLKVAQPSLDQWIVPITAAIVVALFLFQRLGTEAVGRLFGPVMLVWFLAIGALGVSGIADHPEILKALSPTYAVSFFLDHFAIAFFALAAVVLAVTGAEALYADMGHFGHAPITRAWLILVFPACTLSYLGQSALILDDPSNISSPFFLLVPDWGRWPMVFLATAATVIASQAVITGAFSVAHQAVRLGYLPRLRIAQTSAETIGQVYVPWINWLLMVSVLALVLHVRELGGAGFRLRDGGHRHDHDHHAPVLLHRPPPVAEAAVAGGDRGRLPARRRPAVPGREPDEGHARRLAPAADRGHRVRRPHHLAARPGAGHRAARAPRGIAAQVRRRPPPAATARRAGPRDRGVPEPRQGHRSAGDAGQLSSTSTRYTSTS